MPGLARYPQSASSIINVPVAPQRTYFLKTQFDIIREFVFTEVSQGRTPPSFLGTFFSIGTGTVIHFGEVEVTAHVPEPVASILAHLCLTPTTVMDYNQLTVQNFFSKIESLLGLIPENPLLVPEITLDFYTRLRQHVEAVLRRFRTILAVSGVDGDYQKPAEILSYLINAIHEIHSITPLHKYISCIKDPSNYPESRNINTPGFYDDTYHGQFQDVVPAPLKPHQFAAHALAQMTCAPSMAYLNYLTDLIGIDMSPVFERVIQARNVFDTELMIMVGIDNSHPKVWASAIKLLIADRSCNKQPSSTPRLGTPEVDIFNTGFINKAEVVAPNTFNRLMDGLYYLYQCEPAFFFWPANAAAIFALIERRVDANRIDATGTHAILKLTQLLPHCGVLNCLNYINKLIESGADINQAEPGAVVFNLLRTFYAQIPDKFDAYHKKKKHDLADFFRNGPKKILADAEQKEIIILLDILYSHMNLTKLHNYAKIIKSRDPEQRDRIDFLRRADFLGPEAETKSDYERLEWLFLRAICHGNVTHMAMCIALGVDVAICLSTEARQKHEIIYDSNTLNYETLSVLCSLGLQIKPTIQCIQNSNALLLFYVINLPMTQIKAVIAESNSAADPHITDGPWDYKRMGEVVERWSNSAEYRVLQDNVAATISRPSSSYIARFSDESFYGSSSETVMPAANVRATSFSQALAFSRFLLKQADLKALWPYVETAILEKTISQIEILEALSQRQQDPIAQLQASVAQIAGCSTDIVRPRSP